MSWREANALKLDFEDLVRELDEFEQDIQSLQNRIDQFMTDARQTSGEPIEAAESNAPENGDVGGGT